MKKNHLWTAKEIKTILDLWETKNSEEIAEELEIDRGQVLYMAHQIRKEGYKLPKKQRHGKTRLLIKEVLKNYR